MYSAKISTPPQLESCEYYIDSLTIIHVVNEIDDNAIQCNAEDHKAIGDSINFHVLKKNIGYV